VRRRGRTSIAVGVLALLVVAMVLTGCRPAKVGAKCKGTELGRDGTHVLTCTKGRWTRAISFVDLLNVMQEQQREQTRRPLDGIAEVATAMNTTCARLADGTVRCWGMNGDGELGTGAGVASRANPEPVAGVSGATSLVAGRNHFCALVQDGAVTCWGDNQFGELGDGSLSDRFTPVSVFGLYGATAIAAGSRHTCAVVSNGEVQCWGSNWSGELGYGVDADLSAVPAQVLGLSGVTSVAAGDGSTCVVVVGGAVGCWGDNITGQLGDGTLTDRAWADSALVSRPASKVSSGGQVACAILVNGQAECWGSNAGYPLGTDEVDHSKVPRPLPNLTSIAQISIGPVGDVCALLTDSAVTCWGVNSSGRLGFESSFIWPRPGTVALTGATQIAVGGDHTCARMADSTVRCWGSNYGNQTAPKVLYGSTKPVTVTYLP